VETVDQAEEHNLPKIDRVCCTYCGWCVDACASQAMAMTESGPDVQDDTLCGGCGLCEDICPEGAIDCEFEIVWQEESSGPTDGIPG
jgi:ferredoxin